MTKITVLGYNVIYKAEGLKMHTKMESLELAKIWAEEPFSQETKQEVRKLLSNDDLEQIRERFGAEMVFGTAGLRGIMGAGTFFMNEYTVKRATRGLADTLLKGYPQAAKKGVVVGYDCRHRSEEFANIAAGVLVAAGIEVYLYSMLGPTPFVPFAIQQKKAQAGVMITSSHNPKEYNGFKVFWENGAQIISPLDQKISEQIKKIEDYFSIPMVKPNDLVDHSNLIYLDDHFVDEYIKWAVLTGTRRKTRDVKILYTPLHGVGFYSVQKTMQAAGFNDFNVVVEQRDPDGGFPTVSAPNPEKTDAMLMAMVEAKKIGADVVLATDGDGDRIGVAIKNVQGEIISLTGDQIGTVFSYYLLKTRQEKELITGDDFLISSVVSSPMLAKICDSFGVKYEQTLTGFKWMGNVTDRLVEEGGNFIFAYEEAFGVTFGDSRDKDGVIAVTLMAEIAAYCKEQGKTVLDLLDEMFCQYGIYLEAGASVFYKGADGVAQMDKIMDSLRKNHPTKIGGYRVTEVRDVLGSKIYRDGQEVGAVDLPSQNLMQFVLEDGSLLSFRPSGTEPKVKTYLSVHQETTPETINGDRIKLAEKLVALTKKAVELLEG